MFSFVKKMSAFLLSMYAVSALALYPCIAERGDDVSEAAPETFALDESGAVALVAGTHIRWIDRLDISHVDYAVKFYEWLERASDIEYADGALIDYTVLTPNENGVYSYPLNVFKGEGRFSYTGNKEADSDAALAAVMDEITENSDEASAYISSVYSAFDRDHPEVFWLSGRTQFTNSIDYSYNKDGEVEYTQTVNFIIKNDSYDVRAEDWRDAEKIRHEIEKTFTAPDSALKTVLEGIEPNADDREKAEYFNRYLTENNCYNTDIESAVNDSNECISALNGYEGTSAPVCEGYARAFKVLCDSENIPCVLVSGKAITSDGDTESHMWNYVCMDDAAWYAVDVTWNDPVVADVTEKLSGHESEKYLLVGSETYVDGRTFAYSHPISNTVTSGGTAFTNGPVISADAFDSSNTAPIDFSGVCIRTEGVQGLRFVFEMEREYYDSLTRPASAAQIGQGFGALAIPQDVLGGKALTKETEKAKIVPAVKLYDMNDDTVSFSVCIVGITDYSEEFVVIPYVTDSDGKTIYGRYSGGISVYEAAELVCSDENTSESLKKYLSEKILDK